MAGTDRTVRDRADGRAVWTGPGRTAPGRADGRERLDGRAGPVRMAGLGMDWRGGPDWTGPDGPGGPGPGGKGECLTPVVFCIVNRNEME